MNDLTIILFAIYVMSTVFILATYTDDIREGKFFKQMKYPDNKFTIMFAAAFLAFCPVINTVLVIINLRQTMVAYVKKRLESRQLDRYMKGLNSIEAYEAKKDIVELHKADRKFLDKVVFESQESVFLHDPEEWCRRNKVAYDEFKIFADYWTGKVSERYYLKSMYEDRLRALGLLNNN